MSNSSSSRQAKPVRTPLAANLFRGLVAIFGLSFLLTLLPLMGFMSGPRYWPGFFYAPFYTTNIFTDAQTPAAAAGLHSEDRVVGVARSDRIDKLHEVTAQQGEAGAKIRLIYELGRELTAIQVQVEPLSWGRWLEKSGPLLLAALLMGLIGWRERKAFPFLLAIAVTAGLDYWLNRGAGRESGFDPAAWLSAGELLSLSAKWSAFLYWPLWTLACLTTALFVINRCLKGRLRRVALILVITAALSEFGAYCYEASKSATYNNPDYIIWHARAVFWWIWGFLLLLMLGVVLSRWRRWPIWLGLLGLAVFILGFMYPTTFDSAWSGPGPQWYALGLPLFGYGFIRAIARSNSSK
ncbi:MAG TPA: hypothetical protein VH186_18990 [Chloroflexia bacterium]|nr:hypothetical protein [Chloroflexia bacterium]